jgi:hypothetical protein
VEGDAVTDQTEERIADAELAEWQRVAALGLGASPLTTQRLIVEVYRLRALLVEYGRHNEGCTGEWPEYRCRCGWREAEGEFRARA